MQESVKRIVKTLKTVILQWTVRTMVDCSNAALGLNSAVSENHKEINFRRDKVACHECRFCCTLSICTTETGTFFKNYSVFSGKSLNFNFTTNTGTIFQNSSVTSRKIFKLF